MSGPQIVAVCWSMFVLATLLVLLRLYVRVYSRNWMWKASDVFVIVAWLAFLMEAIMDTYLLNTGFISSFFVTGTDPAIAPKIPPERIVSWLKVIYVEDLVYYNTMYAVKASMLLFYFEIIPKILRKTYFMLWVTVIMTIIGWVVQFFLLAFACEPVSSNWSLDPKKQCQAASHTWVLTPALTLHLLTDIMIYCLPIRVVYALNLPRRQKIGVGITFAIGFLDVAFGIVVITLRFAEGNIEVAWIMNILEQTWAIMVACCPAFKAFLTRDLRKGLKRLGWSKKSSKAATDSSGTETGNSTIKEVWQGNNSKESGTSGGRMSAGVLSSGEEKSGNVSTYQRDEMGSR